MKVEYKLDGVTAWKMKPKDKPITIPDKWRSPMFMPERAARTFLKITDVGYGRLQDITEADAIAEGIFKGGNYFSDNVHEAVDETACLAYKRLWNSINPKYPFEGDYWVCRYCFNLIEVEV